MKFLSNKLSVADQVKYEPNDIKKCCNYLTLAIKIFLEYFRIAVADIKFVLYIYQIPKHVCFNSLHVNYQNADHFPGTYESKNVYGPRKGI